MNSRSIRRPSSLCRLNSSMNILGRGAEAVVVEHDGVVVKERLKKDYRVAVLDERLRRQRTRRESSILKKVNALGIPSAKFLDMDDKTMEVEMSFVQGKKLRDVLDNHVHFAEQIGKIVGKLHTNDIVHGDLTTSNLLVHEDVVSVIDFGLSFISKKVEDKAVDLHVLHDDIKSKNNDVHEECFNLIIKGYSHSNPNASEVLERLKVVQSRGRNKK